jgi:hypothetical protein
MPTLVVILGMGRSGTSYLTRALQAAGLYLGDDIMEANHANMEGYGESLECVEINDRILELSAGKWNQLPATLHCDKATDARIKQFVQRLASQPIAGWKDPRTTLTFKFWKPYLGSHQLVGALRHPLKVAQSLLVRDNLPLEEGVRLWVAYNEKLLRIANEATDNFHWFEFDLPEQDLRRSTQLLAQRLGLKTNHSAGALFNPYLRHHMEHEEIADPQARDLYRRLKEKAHRYLESMQRCEPGHRTLPSTVPDRQPHLDRTLQLQDSMIQRCFAALARCEQQIANLEKELQKRAHLASVAPPSARFRSLNPVSFLRRCLSWLKHQASPTSVDRTLDLRRVRSTERAHAENAMS